MTERMALDLQSAQAAAHDGEQLRETMDRMDLEDDGADGSHMSPPGSIAGSEDGQRKKRERHPITMEQNAALSALLKKTAFPSTEEREELAAKYDMTPRRVQVWFQNQRQSLKRAREGTNVFPLRQPPNKPNIPLDANGNVPPNFIPYHNQSSSYRPIAPSSQVTPSSQEPSTTPLATEVKMEEKEPLQREYGVLSGSPTLPPIQNLPPLSFSGWNDASSEQGQFSNDAASIRTFASGSSSSSRGGYSQRSGGGKNLPPLASVLGSSLPPIASDSSSTGSSRGTTSPHHSGTPSIYSTNSRRHSIAPTVADSVSPTSSRRSRPTSISTTHTNSSHVSATPQSIFVNPGHKTRPLTDLLPKPKLSRLFGGGGSSSSSSGPRRGGSNSILDAAITTSQTWSRPIKHPGQYSSSNDILDAAMARRGSQPAMSMRSNASFVSASSQQPSQVFPMGRRQERPAPPPTQASVGLGLEGTAEEAMQE